MPEHIMLNMQSQLMLHWLFWHYWNSSFLQFLLC